MNIYSVHRYFFFVENVPKNHFYTVTVCNQMALHFARFGQFVEITGQGKYQNFCRIFILLSLSMSNC